MALMSAEEHAYPTTLSLTKRGASGLHSCRTTSRSVSATDTGSLLSEGLPFIYGTIAICFTDLRAKSM